MVILKFLTHWSPYQPGEVAGFPDSVAKSLIEAGVAEYFEEKPVERAQGDDYKAGAVRKQVGRRVGR
jgi:hypothetical protein